MKKLTRDRVVPIISTSVSWLIFAIIGSGLSGQFPPLTSQVQVNVVDPQQ